MNLQPPAVLLQGAPGAGKTDSLATLLAAGLEVFVIMTEPGGVESLLDSCARRKISVDKLHWTSVLPAAAGWSAIDDMIRTVATSSFEQIQLIKSGVGKDLTRKPAMALLEALKDFPCERTGQKFGDVASWDPERALCVDSLSGLSLMSMALAIGYKPAAHQGEWGVAMNFLEQLLLKLTSDRKCFFVLTAHVEKEANEITGVAQIMASTLGRKLAPKIPRFFSEVVYAKRTLTNGKASFLWSTIDEKADLKNRALPVSAAIEPNFEPIVAAYRRRVEMAASAPLPPTAVPSARPSAPFVAQTAPMAPKAT